MPPTDAERIIRELREVPSSWGFGSRPALAKLRAHPERLALFLAGREREITPVNLEVWPSLSCNARCSLCPYIKSRAREQADKGNPRDFLMDLELFREIAAGFKQAGGLSVNLTGGGEPTMHPALPSFGAIAKDQGLQWGLFTNGYKLDDRCIDELLESEPAWIRVSINSWSRESHDRTYRLGLDAYDLVLERTIRLATRAPTSTTIGLGYIFSPTQAQLFAQQLEGVSAFIAKVTERKGRLDYVAIRPAMLY